jgi:predicted RNA binding protein YcfA (HicA-like mRNA interferase family)
LRKNGFVFHKQGATSHKIYRGVVKGEVRLVTVAAHSISDDVKPGILASIIRQSGLPKSKFR